MINETGAIAILAQAQTAGRLDVDEFSALCERAPKLVDLIVAGTKLSRGSLRIIAKDGRLTLRMIEETLR